MQLKYIISVTGILVALSPCAQAHGLFAVTESNAAAIRFHYDDGAPVAAAGVTVLAPGVDDPFLKTETDPNGLIAFVPDREGVWTVTVDDGLGHMISSRVSVDAEGVAEWRDHRHHPSRITGVIAGVSVIFGVFGMAAWWSARKKS